MPKNNVMKYREAKSLSYQEFAVLLRTTVDHVILLETGGLVMDLSLVVSISEVLGKSVETIFPAFGKAWRKLQKTGLICNDPDLAHEAEAVGVDAEDGVNSFRFVLDNGLERSVALSGGTRAWLRDALQEKDGTYIIFDTPVERIAINRHHLAVWEFGICAGEPIDWSALWKWPTVSLWTSSQREAIQTSVDADPLETSDEQHDLREREINGLFFDLEHASLDEIIGFVGSEGERVYFNTSRTPMISVNLQAVIAELADNGEDEPVAA